MGLGLMGPGLMGPGLMRSLALLLERRSIFLACSSSSRVVMCCGACPSSAYEAGHHLASPHLTLPRLPLLFPDGVWPRITSPQPTTPRLVPFARRMRILSHGCTGTHQQMQSLPLRMRRPRPPPDRPPMRTLSSLRACLAVATPSLASLTTLLIWA